MSKNEDILDVAYPYAWSKLETESDVKLDEFLARYKPSMVQDDGTKPWLWVKRSDPVRHDTGVERAVEESLALINGVAEKVETIKDDNSIPVRSNKKTGAKSKKELREKLQTEATEKLKHISQEHGYVSGKWLIFAPADKVDMIWSKLASSLITGPLSETHAFSAKVATSPKNDTPNYQHVICVYLPDVYDKDSVTQVLRILLRNHGVSPIGVKSNLYTSIGLDSKHGSGISSTVWKPSGLLKDTEIKELKDAFFAEIKSSTDVSTAPVAMAETVDSEVPKAKIKPKSKKKIVDDDPFASDEDSTDKQTKKPTEKKPPRPKKKDDQIFADDDDHEDESEAERKKAPKPKKAGTSKRKPAAEDAFEDDDEAKHSEEERAAILRAKKAPKKRKTDQDDEGKPKRKRGGR